MSRINSLRDIKAQLKELNELTGILEKDWSEIHEFIDNGRFIPEKLGEKMSDGLCNIEQVQKNIEQQFTSLEIGKFTDQIYKLESILDENQKIAEIQDKYMEIIEFFLSLHSDDEEIERLLNARKDQVKQLNISTMNESDLNENLKPYLLLKNAFFETDVTKKFSLMYQLPQYFEEGIFSGLGCGKLFISPETESDMAEAEEDALIVNQTKESSDTSKNEDIWVELGIEDPSSVCHKERSELLIIENYPKAADKFGVSKFKKDILKQLCNLKLDCMVEAVNGCAYTKESIALNLDHEEGYYDLATAKLHQQGYLSKYIIKGMGDFYALSSRGEKAFQTKESLSFIKGVNSLVDTFSLMNIIHLDTANAAICRILLTSCYSKVLQMDESYVFQERRVIPSKDTFFLCIPDVFGEYTFVFVGIVTEKENEFKNVLQEINKIPEEYIPDFLIVVEPDKNLAFHVAKWISSFTDSNTAVGYCIYNEKEIYDISTESPLIIQPSDESDDILDDFFDNEYPKVELPEDNEICNESSEEGYYKPDHVSISEEEVETKKRKLDSMSADKESSTEISVSSAETQNKNSAPVKEITKEDFSKKETKILSNKAAVSGTVTHPEFSFSEKDKEEYDLAYQKMLASGKLYAATAFLKSLSNQDPFYKNVYLQLAYAVNDPMGNCSYNCDTIINVFYTDGAPVSEYYLISACIRDFFYDQFNYEHKLPQLQSIISKSTVLRENHALEELLYELQKFKSDHSIGMNRYADYREKEQGLLEERMEQTRREAKGYYDNYSSGYQKENASHKRFIETYRLLFGPKSDLSVFLKDVFEDKRDKDTLDMLEIFLSENCIKEKAVICEENIDPAKINHILDDYWVRAAQNMKLVKKTSDLMSSLRMNLFKKVQKVIIVLCKYFALCRSSISKQDDPVFMEYKKHRNTILANIESALKKLTITSSDKMEIQAGKAVLCKTLEEIQSRITGEYKEGINKYFYIDFLKSDKILLDDNFYPVLDEVLELPTFSVKERILKHCECSNSKSWEERIDDIYTVEDNYGSTNLIFQYVEDQNIPFKDLEEKRDSKDKAMKYPEIDMDNKRKEFIEDLELAQSYGQIDNSRVNTKEIIVQIMENWYEWAKNTANYGFFSQILDAFLAKIHEDSKAREAELANELKVYLDTNSGHENDKTIETVVKQIKERIQQQNYAAAEDLLNRLIRNDLDTDDFMQQQPDYLAEFLDEYDINYRKTANSGFTLKSLLSSNRSNKDTKGASKLLENWPKGMGVGENRLQILLSSLGFNTDTVKAEARIQDKIESYLVTLKRPKNGRKSNYKHPIAAFGSEAETKGFRVVCLFGKTDASRLIDTFKEIGNAKNTLVLLDYSLLLSDRRLLARKTKTDLSGKIFAVIDRVALLYLAKHYSETAVNRMLMHIIMPFASYQPYIDQSVTVMPQEIFIGRRDELEKIESATGVNLVYGGRQLGKTALLRMAQKDIDMNENGDRAVIVDVHDKDYHEAAKAISAALFDEGILKEENITDDWDELSRDIKKRLRDKMDPIPYFLLMIDEADRFIESSEKVNYRPFDALKDIQSIGSGRFKFVVAGLRNIVRFKKSTVLKNNNSLVHLDSLTVKPFKAMEARELLEVPLSYLGFRFPKDNETEVLISAIFGTTNYFPGLIQMYCTKMIETMRRDYAGYSESETPSYSVKP